VKVRPGVIEGSVFAETGQDIQNECRQCCLIGVAGTLTRRIFDGSILPVTTLDQSTANLGRWVETFTIPLLGCMSSWIGGFLGRTNGAVQLTHGGRR
jgi:hypothetical protein